jgi:hypothetical protein
MNKSILIAVGAGVGLVAAALFSFEYMQSTGWNDERVDPYTLKAVCKTTTYVGVFGKASYKVGPPLPNSECKEAVNFWLTEAPNEGCSVDKNLLTATCKEAYKNPFF